MENSEMMTLTLRRIDICDVRIALTSIITDMCVELHSDNTSEDRKKISKGLLVNGKG